MNECVCEREKEGQRSRDMKTNGKEGGMGEMKNGRESGFTV